MRTKAAIKLHTLLDLKGSIPSSVQITDGTVHDVRVLDELIPEPGSIYVMDRGYVDFKRLHLFTDFQASFVARQEQFSLPPSLLPSRGPHDRADLRSDGLADGAPVGERLPRSHSADSLQGSGERQDLRLPDQQLHPPALTITELYRCRWQIELLFKWIKQHLRIKVFYGTSENAVKTQIWTAIATYVLVAILKKRLGIGHSLYTILQILSITVFEKMPMEQALSAAADTLTDAYIRNQLLLFDL